MGGLVAADLHPVHNGAIVAFPQRSVRKRDVRDIGQRMNLVVDDSAILTVRKTEDILAWDPCDNLSDDLFAYTPRDHVDIRTTLKQIFHLLRGFVTPDDCTNLRR
jgi:hypothetical protein